MMGDSGEVDLYADDLGEELPHRPDEGDAVDLYDDVLAPSHRSGDRDAAIANGPRPSSPMTNGSPVHYPGKRFGVIVGNLTWWTTDRDIEDAVKAQGVTDFYDVKFYENRANGQSKGFCVITVGSENSVRIILDRVPKKEIHGQLPVALPNTKQAIAQVCAAG